MDNNMLYFWLGDIAEKVEWYSRNYEGIALRCHLAMIKPELHNTVIHPIV